MTATVADRPSPPAGRADVRHGRVRVVLVGLVIGLFAGAIACAAGLASAGAHHAIAAPADAVDHGEPHHDRGHGAHHADHVSGDHGERGDTDPASPVAAGSLGHPGMACLVPFDLLVPAPSSIWSTSPHLLSAAAMGTKFAVDVDPPVPRSS